MKIEKNTIVRYIGRRRLYAVASRDITGQYGMIALSGGFAGCAPSSVKAKDIEIVEGHQLFFAGKRATYLKNRFTLALRHGWSE